MTDSPPPTSATIEQLQLKCWQSAIHTRATAFIFEHRYRLLRRQLRAVEAAAVIVPASFGCFILAAGSSSTSWLLPAGTVAALLSGLASILASSLQWRERMSKSLVSFRENDRLTARYERLAGEPPKRKDDFVQAKARLDDIDEAQTGIDVEHGVTDEEKRMGFREAHRLRNRPCLECDTVPPSLEPSDCGACGNFNLRRFIW